MYEYMHKINIHLCKYKGNYRHKHTTIHLTNQQNKSHIWRLIKSITSDSTKTATLSILTDIFCNRSSSKKYKIPIKLPNHLSFHWHSPLSLIHPIHTTLKTTCKHTSKLHFLAWVAISAKCFTLLWMQSTMMKGKKPSSTCRLKDLISDIR